MPKVIPVLKKRRHSFMVPGDLHQRIKIRAAVNDVQVGILVEKLLTDGLDKLEKVSNTGARDGH